MQIQIDGQGNILAFFKLFFGDKRRLAAVFFKNAQGVTLASGEAPLQRRFQAALAQQITGAIAFGVHLSQLFGGDLPQVARQVGCSRPGGIAAPLYFVDHHPGDLQQPLCEALLFSCQDRQGNIEPLADPGLVQLVKHRLPGEAQKSSYLSGKGRLVGIAAGHGA